MKKNYTFLCLAAFAATTVCAQQLPNAGFEGAFDPTPPWTSAGNTCYNAIVIDPTTGESSIVPLKSPTGWCASNVIGIPTVSENEETGVTTPVGLGATGVVAEVEGYNSEKAIKIFNSPNSILPTQIVPGYLTLGTTWSTSVMGSENDGGVWGGIEFAYRPDALAFYYKRERVSAPEDADEYTAPTYKPEEPTTIVAYLWNGTWTQNDVPADIAMWGAPTTCNMTDRDRNILGMETAKGGEVVPSEDAALVAVINTQIKEDAADWTLFLAPFEYISKTSEAAPSYANVILAAGDYFGGAEVVGNGNSLTVDDVKFVYYSRIAFMSVNGVDVPGFDSNVYSYTLEGAVPSYEDISFEVLGQGNGAEEVVSIKGNVVTITITNDGADIDGEKSHVYTLTFKDAEAAGDNYDGLLNITMMGGPIATDQPATINILPTGEGKCTFTLPNFALDIGGGPTPLGDIIVPDVEMTTADGVTTYKGSVKGLSLAGGEIVADVNLTGTTNALGEANMNINVMWQNIPISVTFNGMKASGIGNVTVDAEAPVEYYNLNGIRVDAENLSNGIYIRRQGSKVSKIIVK